MHWMWCHEMTAGPGRGDSSLVTQLPYNKHLHYAGVGLTSNTGSSPQNRLTECVTCSEMKTELQNARVTAGHLVTSSSQSRVWTVTYTHPKALLPSSDYQRP